MFFVGIHFDESGAGVHSGADLGECWSHCFAGATPWSPKIDNDRHVILGDLGSERGLIYRLWRRAEQWEVALATVDFYTIALCGYAVDCIACGASMIRASNTLLAQPQQLGTSRFSKDGYVLGTEPNE